MPVHVYGNICDVENIDRIVHKHGQYNVMDTSIVLHISERVLTLPMYADFVLEDVDRICDIIIKCRKDRVK